MRVLVGGTFNLLHPGHVFFLEKAKKLGDELIVVIATDRVVAKKGFSLFSAEERMVMVNELKVVDRAVIGSDSDFLKIIEIEKPDVIALGSDQKLSEEELKEQLKERGLDVRVVRIKERLGSYSTAKILKKIRE